MAVIVNCLQCHVPATRCEAVIRAWQDLVAGQSVDVRAQALERLAVAPAALLAAFGLEDRSYAEAWIRAPRMSLGLATTMLLSDGMSEAVVLPPAVWHALLHHGSSLGLPTPIARGAFSGHRLADWLARMSGTSRVAAEPTDALVGKWVHASMARRLLPYLRDCGEDPVHDAIRKLLNPLTASDWLVVSVIA